MLFNFLYINNKAQKADDGSLNIESDFSLILTKYCIITIGFKTIEQPAKMLHHPSFLAYKKKAGYRQTDKPTDGRTDGLTFI